MIQRIQSLFLLLATILVIIALTNALYFLQVNLKEASSGMEFISNLGLTQQVIYTEGKGDITIDWYKSIALSIIGLMSVVTIFLFKNRGLQMRIIRLTMLAIIAYLFALLYFGYNYVQSDATFEILSYNVKPTGAIAIACLLLLQLLAFKYVKKDDELVKSADRFR